MSLHPGPGMVDSDSDAARQDPVQATPGPARGVVPELVGEILESLPVAVLVIDAGQRIREVNREACRLFGFRREQLLDAPLERLLPERVRGAHAGWVREFLRQAEPRAMGGNRDLLAQRADGSVVPVEIALNPIRGAGELFVIAAVLDLTARKALEQRVLADKAELEQQVRERTAELERLTREDPLTGLATRREF